MRLVKSLSLLITFCLCSCATSTPNLDSDLVTEKSTIQNNISSQKSLFVRFKDISKSQINNFNSSNNISNFKILSNELNLAEIKVANQSDLSLIKDKYQKSNLVKYIETDGNLNLFPYDVSENTSNFSIKEVGVKPNDTFYDLQWNALTINADKAWTVTTGNENITIAVIDSGVDPEHPDLQDNLLPMIDIVNESGTKDIYDNGSELIDYTGEDGNGHGTHVTGILGALINNGAGVAGIAGNISILPIKVANHEGKTSSSLATKAILRAIDKGVRVINLSVGGPKSEGTQALKDAVQLAIDKGIVFVSATGNDSNRKNNVVNEITVPAAYPGVISVSAINKAGKVANYSNGGPEVEITAPGGSDDSDQNKIVSTWPTYRTYLGYKEKIIGPYARLSGTSMACPHVSAVAALLLTKEPNLTVQQVRVRILSAASDIEAKGFDTATGFGSLDAYKTLITNTDEKLDN